MIEGYFVADEKACFRRPHIDVAITSPESNGNSIEVSFVIDTGADLTLISPFDGQRICRQLGVDMHSLPLGKRIGGIGGQVDTKAILATLVIGSYKTTMQIPIVDLPPGPNDMPSLIGRDIIYDFALFMEHGRDRLFLLRDAEEMSFLLDS